MAAETRSDRQKHDEIDGIILQYLERNQLNETSKSFRNELLSIGRQLPTDENEETQRQKKNKQLIKAEKEGLLRLFDRGETDAFFDKLNAYERNKFDDDNDDYLKLEFSLQLHFAVFRLRSPNEDENESNANDTAVDVEQHMHKFKVYLENSGAALSQEPEFLPYFALPYITNPSQHSSFKNLFSESWILELRQHLQNHLDVIVKIKEEKEDPRLIQMYNSYTNNLNIPPVNPATIEELSAKLQWERQKLLALQANYQKLMHITTELLSALETSVRGGSVNLSDVMDTCLQAFPELFTGGAHLDLDAPPPPAGVCGGGSSQNIRMSVIEAQRRSVSLVRSETQDMLLVSLDYKNIKRDLISSPPRLKMFLLQALRWRLTRSRQGEQRRSVLSAYTGYDLLGTDGGQYGDAIMSLIMSQTIELRQTMARFLNALASLTAGRSYLSYGSNILNALMDNVRFNKLEAISLDMSLSTLQKLSLRRQLQTAMINSNLIEYLISTLEDEDALSDYALEYTVALLMNLCLRTAGKERCIKNSRAVLKILTNLLGNPNPEIIPYVNGTLYSLLTVAKIKREAQSMGLEEILNSFMNEASPEMRRQLEFILKQLASEDPVEEMTSDYEDEDDDDEEQDVLEEELDKDDVILIIPGELQGEALLAANYSVHANAPKSKEKQNDAAHLLMRPGTPRIQTSLSSLRRSSTSSQAWTTVQQMSEVIDESKSEAIQQQQQQQPTPGAPTSVRAQTPRSPILNVDQYASRVLNEVVGIEKPVTEAVGFPPVLPREPEKFGGTSVNEYVVAFSSRPKIPRTPEHSGRRSQSPYFDNSMFRDGL